MKIKFSAILTLDSALKAVERNGDALQYVKDQTEAVCLKAVERNGYALQYVKDQTLFIKVAGILKIEIEV